MINNVNIFTKYDILLQNVIKMTIYQNQSKVLGSGFNHKKSKLY